MTFSFDTSMCSGLALRAQGNPVVNFGYTLYTANKEVCWSLA
jgi:hypothetical protein